MWKLAPARLCEGAVLLLGTWQLYFTVCVRVGATFDTLYTFLFLPLLLAGVLLAVPSRPLLEAAATSEPVGPDEIPAWGPWVLGAAVVGLFLWHARLVPFVLVLALALASLLVLSRRKTVTARVEQDADALDYLWMAMGIGLAVTAVLWIHRPNNDDGFYVNQIWTTLQHADRAVLSFDGIHGDLTAPVQQPAHRAQSFEVIFSVLVRFTGLDARDLYYLYVPILSAAAMPVVAWLVARQWFGQWVARGTAVLITLLIVPWGGTILAVGNFGFSRLFQGKGVLASVMLPIIIVLAYRFANAPTARSWMLLMLAQVAGAGLSSTGLVVAPICAALVVLASLNPDARSARLAALGAATALPNLVMTLLVKIDVDAMGNRGGTGPTSTLSHYLDTTWRVPLALAVMLLLPWLVRRAKLKVAPWIARYMLILFALLFSGYFVAALASVAGNLYSLRTYWAAPFVILIASALVLSVRTAMQEKKLPALAAVGVVLYLAAFWAAGTKTYDPKNIGSLRFAQWKVLPEEFAVAERLVRDADPDSLVLAPPLVAGRVTTFPNAPAVVAIRRDYLVHLHRHWNEQEYVSRRGLIRLALGLQTRNRMEWVVRKLDKWCVDRIALPMGLADRHPGLREDLRAMDYEHEFVHTYEVWIRDRSTCDSVKGRAGVRARL